MPHSTRFQDQDYCILANGDVFSVHGDIQRGGILVGEMAYVIDDGGPYVIRGRRYRKPYLDVGSGHIVDNNGHVQTTDSPSHDFRRFFDNKSTIEVARVVEHLSTADLLEHALNGEHANELGKIIANMQAMLPLPTSVNVALTGSLGVVDYGTMPSPHDFDITLRMTNVIELENVVSHLQSIPTKTSKYRLWEYGKYWRIRILTDCGILCPFFSVNEGNSRLIDASDDSQAVVSYVGMVINASRTATLPIELVIRLDDGSDDLIILSYDLRLRGEFALGDRGWFRGVVRELRGDLVGRSLFLQNATDCGLLNDPWIGYSIQPKSQQSSS